jgi:hypothetical protein
MSHEDYSRDRSAAMGSDRSFGLVIAAAIAIISMLPLRHGELTGLAAAPISLRWRSRQPARHAN